MKNNNVKIENCYNNMNDIYLFVGRLSLDNTVNNKSIIKYYYKDENRKYFAICNRKIMNNRRFINDCIKDLKKYFDDTDNNNNIFYLRYKGINKQSHGIGPILNFKKISLENRQETHKRTINTIWNQKKIDNKFEYIQTHKRRAKYKK